MPVAEVVDEELEKEEITEDQTIEEKGEDILPEEESK